MGLLLGGLLLQTPARGQADRTPAFDFLQIPPSASTAAAAGSAVAEERTDLSELFYNPSLLTERSSGRAIFTYLNHVGDLNGSMLGYAHHLGGWGTIGGAIRYLGYGSLERRTRSGEKLGEFGANDLALTLAFARAYSAHVRFGGSVHLVTSSVADYRTSAVAFDLGTVFRWPANALTVQAALTNGGRSVLRFGTVPSRLPLDLRATVAKRLEHVPVRVSLTGYDLNAIEPDTARSTGREILRHVTANLNVYLGSTVTVRLGYSPRTHRALSSGGRLDLAGLTTGLTIDLARVRFDYAYRSWSGYGGLHFLTLQTRIR